MESTRIEKEKNDMTSTRLLLTTWFVAVIVFAVSIWFRQGSFLLLFEYFLSSVCGLLLPFFIDSYFDVNHKITIRELYAESPPVSVFRSYPMIASTLMCILFTFTSSNSVFEKGFLVSFGSIFIGDFALSFFRHPSSFEQRWFSHFRTKLTANEMKFFVFFVCALSILFLLFGLFA